MSLMLALIRLVSKMSPFESINLLPAKNVHFNTKWSEMFTGSVPAEYHKTNIDIVRLGRQICVFSRSLQNGKNSNPTWQ